jgi:nitrogen fixation protein FixH
MSMRLRRLFFLSDENPFTGWHMLAVVLLFFGVVIGANVVLAVTATGTFPGLVVHNSYVASQEYNDLLAEARTREGVAWRMDLDAPDGVVNVRFVDGDGRSQHYLLVTALAGRPSSALEDRAIEFIETAEGYRSPEPLSPGLWEIDVEARRGGEVVFRELRRAYVRPDGEG